MIQKTVKWLFMKQAKNSVGNTLLSTQHVNNTYVDYQHKH